MRRSIIACCSNPGPTEALFEKKSFLAPRCKARGPGFQDSDFSPISSKSFRVYYFVFVLPDSEFVRQANPATPGLPLFNIAANS